MKTLAPTSAPRLDRKSVQEVSKQKSGRLPKTDLRYWQKAIFQPTYTRGGEVFVVQEWSVKIQHLGRRETFSLGTPNRAAAAAKAKEVYLTLQGAGWDAALAKYKPVSHVKPRTDCTVGEFLTEIKANADGRAKTVEGYAKALRKIVAEIMGIVGGKKKYDYRSGGHKAWIDKVHAVKLANITPEKVQRWKRTFLAKAGNDPVKQRRAQVSANSFLRQAKSLFAPDMLRFVNGIVMPEPLPFTGVAFEKRPSMRYRSTFDIEEVIRLARTELAESKPEQFKIFLLAVMVGLRREEIDKLEWSAFRWDEEVIRIEATNFIALKSEDSIADVEVDPEVIELFRGYRARATGRFVIESRVVPRTGVLYGHYRCQRDFEKLLAWLRSKGVSTPKPLHSLRAEYGSQICARHGIYAASRALRHADIKVTTEHYVDKKHRVTVGLGALLKDDEKIVPIGDPEAESAAATA